MVVPDGNGIPSPCYTHVYDTLAEDPCRETIAINYGQEDYLFSLLDNSIIVLVITTVHACPYHHFRVGNDQQNIVQLD